MRTRAEILAEIHNCRTDCHCERVPECRLCTIAWMRQEIDYLNSLLNVSRDGRAVLAAELEYRRVIEMRK